MIVKYIVPEDGDELAHPNVFEMVTMVPPTFAQFKSAFPYPGHYHFRFLTTVHQRLVWLDITNHHDILPLYKEEIVVKASRLPAPSEDLIDFANTPIVAQSMPSNATADLLSLYE
jgi:hypothetical protein